MKEVELVSTGIYLPGDPVPFDKIEDMIGHLDQATPRMHKMIEKLRPTVKDLIGIKQCHFAVDPVTKMVTETNASMSAKAIQTAFKKADMKAQDIDCILLASPWPDYQTPPTTPFIQQALNIEKCAEMEVHSNCTGVSKVFQIAFDALRVGRYKNIAVTYSQLSSPYLLARTYNQQKLKTADLLLRWFLSDSASSFILTAKDKVRSGIKVLDVYNELKGCHLKPAMWTSFGATRPDLLKLYEEGLHHLSQDYSAVSEIAPGMIATAFKDMFVLFGVDSSKVDHLLSTVPSVKLLEMIKEKVFKETSISHDKWFANMHYRGYSGGSSVIIGLDEMIEKHIFKPGESLACVTIESSKWMVGGFVLENLK